jgi:hypothetical protein
MQIHKHVINRGQPLTFTLKTNGQILTAQSQRDGTIAIWYEIDTRYDYPERHFVITETGKEFSISRRKYIATVQLLGWVGHIYEIL